MTKKNQRPSKRHQGLELPRSVHFLGICGRMVGGLAMALKARGVRVSGSDAVGFPPMVDLLHEAGIHLNIGWSIANLPADAEVVVTGVTIPRGDNPELEAALDGLAPVWNATEFLEHYFLRQSENFVVAGTKGKTTTTAMLTWIFQSAGLAHDRLIGGQVRGGLERLCLAGAERMVIEGDEYWCGLHYPSPKFLRYHPRHIIVTNIHHDHENIYPTVRSYELVFWQLISLVPPKGSITLSADDEGSLRLHERSPMPTRLVGFSSRADCRIKKYRAVSSGSVFHLEDCEFRLKLAGRMNALNAALAAICARNAGVTLKASAEALSTFPGVEGRQDVIARAGASVIYADDAFHPFALRALLEAMRARHPGRRIILVFQPRYTGGRAGAHQRELPEALAGTDVALILPSLEVCDAHKTFSHRILCRELVHRGLKAHAVASSARMETLAASVCRDGDIVIISLAMGDETTVKKIAAAVVRSLEKRTVR